MTRDAVWNRPAKPLMWPHLFQESKWLMFASLSNFAVDWGPFLLLVPLGVATPDAAGQFYWAFSITAQVAILLGWNLMAVLTPALQRLNEEPTRQAQAVLRSLRSVMLTGCFASLGISAVFFPLEQIIWHGKWHDSVPAVIILGVFFPWRITFGVTSSLLQAQGHFRKYAILTLIEGVGFTAAVILGALWSKETMRATAAMSLAGGLWLLVSRLVLTVRTLRPIGITAGDVFRATVPAWLLSIVSAGAGLGLSLLLREHLATTIDKLFEDAGKHTSLHALMFLIAGCTCTLVFAVASRMFLTHHVQEALAVAPAKIQRPLAALLRLRIAPARKAP